VGLLGVNSLSNKSHNSALIKLTVEVTDAKNLARVVDRLKQLPDVNDVARD
jgi:GTP pyrophosphokinase